MSYNRYINFSIKGIILSSIVVSLFLQIDEKEAKAASNKPLSIAGTTEPEDDGVIYITEGVLERGYEIFSSPNWMTGDNSPRNYSDPELKALKNNQESKQTVVQQTQRLSVDKYKDYDSNAYWAKDMKWAIDQGLITGYQNQKHPSQPSKGVGNWIDPYGSLTEYQMLNVMLRYRDGTQFESAKIAMKDKTATNFAYVEYHFANIHGIMTKGSTSNANFAKKQVTRGQMAQALVSMHYGKSVTLQQAVDFMYANGLTTGGNSSRGQTLENFGADTKLARAHIVAFIGRYNDAVKEGQLKDTLNNPTEYSTVTTPPNPTAPKFEHTKYDYSNLYGEFDTSKIFEFHAFKVFKRLGSTFNSGGTVIEDYLGPKGELGKEYTGEIIMTSYKNHTYNVGSQKDYDQVINYVDKVLTGKTYGDIKPDNQNDEFELEILERLMNNEITIITDLTNPASRNEENMKAHKFKTVYGEAINLGISFDTLAKYHAASYYVSAFSSQIGKVIAPLEKKHDTFTRRPDNYISTVYASQAIYDALGYNTAVVHSNSEYLIIELDGIWYEEKELEPFTKKSVTGNEFIKFAPTKSVEKLNFIKIM